MESIELAQGVALNKKIIDEYYNAMHFCMLEEYLPLQVFKQQYEMQYKHLNAVHHKRSVLKECVNAMRCVSGEIYFGTLTFNNAKNLNKITTKRKQAFKDLNTVFEYVVLVEEYGEDNGRYHIHFLGVFKSGCDFHSFVSAWKNGRQNLRLVREGENVAQYLCKYFVKTLPRVRRNKKLICLAREYHRARCLRNNFPNVPEFQPEYVCKNYHFISALDDV